MARRGKQVDGQTTKARPVQQSTIAEDSPIKVVSKDGKNEYAWNEMFAASHTKIQYRDLNGRYTTPTFTIATKDEIADYIGDPATYENELREAVKYIYGASSHFRRLIQYFVGLTDLAYVVAPTGFDAQKANPKTVQSSYKKTLNVLKAMDIRGQVPDILTVCLREDVYYGTMWVTDCSIIFQQLDSRYCKISTIQDGVFNVTFNFSYFDTNAEMIEFFPPEFKTKYNQYLRDRQMRWIELDSPTSFAVKCNRDIPEYAMPPFAGILRELYDLEDYKGLKLTKTALENYSLLNMVLPMDDEGNWLLPFDQAKSFWFNLDSVIPEEVGSILSPMELKKIDFDKSNTGDIDNISNAEENLFTAAGVSSLLFNNPKASANALMLSIKVDQEITFGLVKSIEQVINRYLHEQSFSSKFHFTFLNVSTFNRKEMGDQYLKAAQYGLPTIMMYAASQGLSQLEVDSMSFLENDVLELKERLVPLMSSNTMATNGDSSDNSSASSSSTSDEGGRPNKDVEDLSDSGEQNQEDGDDWG